MTAKERIDKFIGEIVNLTKVNDSPKYQYSEDKYINSAYWKGYNDAKIELRTKLYDKENIKVEENYSDWSPEFNLTLFGEPLYDKK